MQWLSMQQSALLDSLSTCCVLGHDTLSTVDYSRLCLIFNFKWECFEEGCLSVALISPDEIALSNDANFHSLIISDLKRFSTIGFYNDSLQEGFIIDAAQQKTKQWLSLTTKYHGNCWEGRGVETKR